MDYRHCRIKRFIPFSRTAIREPVSYPEKPPEQLPLSQQDSGNDYGAEETVFCIKCGRKMAGDSLFCSKCGSKLIKNKDRLCRKCGKRLDDDSTFCRFCGAEVSGNKLAEQKKAETDERRKTIYENSVRVFESSDSSYSELIKSAKALETLGAYKDSESLAAKCRDKAEEIHARLEEEEKRDSEEAAELELQYCINILENEEAQISELEEAQERLLLIQDHEGAEEALEECRIRLEDLREKHEERTPVIVEIVIMSIIVLFVTIMIIKFS